MTFENRAEAGADTDRVTLFLCGDVMTGRGVDQILPQPCGHQIFESYVHRDGCGLLFHSELDPPVMTSAGPR